MARPPRLELAGVPMHVVQRGVNRAACFFGDADRRFYLKCLAKAAIKRGCAVHAYVLMSNHVHLLVTPRVKGAVSAMIQDVGRAYVRIINAVHDRTGTLWQGRFKSSLVDSETYLLVCHRYIECNPVRAGIVDHPARYPWSSHAHYALGVHNPLVSEHSIYATLGETAEERQAAFRNLFQSEMEKPILERIRQAANTGSGLGGESFLERLSNHLGRNVRAPKRGRPQKLLPTERLVPISDKLF